MSINDYPHYSQSKEHFKPTSHKSDFSFSSPKEDPPTVIKQPLLESRRLDTFRNRVELFTEIKENTSISSMVNKSYSKQFVDQMRVDQRMEVEKLLLEISRLHDLLEDQQKVHRHTINRLKEESEQISLLRISNLKQSQFSQIELIEIQLKKTREALEEKNIMYEELEKVTNKKIESLVSQNQILRSDLKSFVEKKNLEIHELRNQYARENQDATRKQNESLEQLRVLADKQLKKVIKRLEQKQEDIAHLSNQREEAEKQNKKLQQMFESERRELDEKIERIINDQRERRDSLTQSLKIFYLSEAELSHQNLEQQRQLFISEINQLMKIIGIKDEESRRSFVYREAEKIDYKLQIKSYKQENESLKKLAQTLKKHSLQQIEHLKVKMAVLHKSDIEALVALYEAKIQTLTKDLQYAQGQTERAEQEVKKEREAIYELKKKYDYTVSMLHQEISELRIGASHHQKQMKEKLQNEKSMMMLTSRNFIKENEAKANNIRFYEQQLRKLRQLLEIQAEEVEQSQKNVEQKIKLAEDELSRLSNKIIEVKSQAEENQRKLKSTVEQKNKEIKRLNQILNVPKNTKKIDDGPMQELKRLDEEITKKQDEIRSLKNKCGDLQSQIRLVKTDNQRLIMQNQINTEDAKKKYKVISDKNLADMKAFYDRRLQELENDKRELGRVITSQTEQITELIKKYKELQEGLSQLMKQTKKRSDLQARIIELGMDNNLVKNMAELFHH